MVGLMVLLPKARFSVSVSGCCKGEWYPVPAGAGAVGLLLCVVTYFWSSDFN